jgi:uncharacterized protein DUF3999
MSKRSASLRASVACVAAALAATAAALDPLEFVAGWPIETPADAEVFDVPLTAEVYAAAESIRQIAILDLNGEPQPFFRRVPATPSAPTERRVVLEASPLYVGGATAAPSVGVTTGPAGTSVTVVPGSASSPAITGFVLDARAVDTAPVALELDWRELPQPFLLDVAVEQSTDLTSWSNVGRASVAALAIGDSVVRHARVPVRASSGGYYRITPRGSVADWHLLRATLVISVGQQPAAPPSIRVPPLAVAVASEAPSVDTLYFDAGGSLPVESLALVFAGDGWVRADVAASRSMDGPWIPVAYRELFYSLSFEGRELASEPVKLGRQEARYWRVVPDSPLRGQRLELELAFQQEHLRVAARGGAPYLLVAGTLADEAGPDATLASVWSALDPPAVDVPLATLGARRELGGGRALVAPRVFPWRTAALWTVLVLGVLVVGAMAVRLAKEMQKPSP